MCCLLPQLSMKANSVYFVFVVDSFPVLVMLHMICAIEVIIQLQFNTKIFRTTDTVVLNKQSVLVQ